MITFAPTPEPDRPPSSSLAIDGGQSQRREYLPFGEPTLSEEEIEAVSGVLRSGWIGSGQVVLDFEAEFATAVGTDAAVAVNSCTAALHLSLLALGIGAGDEVILPALTFVATANAVVHSGATPVLADVDPWTLNVTPDTIASCLTEKTRAVVPVHFGGLACDLDGIYAIAKEARAEVVEDCAHAVGATYKGRPIGSSPGLCCFSFYANKNITTVEGGMITSSSRDCFERLRSWRLHGLSQDAWRRYGASKLIKAECSFPGFKYNLPDVHAAIGLVQLKKLPHFLSCRERNAAYLDSELAGIPGLTLFSTLPRDSGTRHALHLYLVRLDTEAFRASRDEIVAAVRAENIGAGIHYEPIHWHPYYRNALDRSGSLPVAEQLGAELLTLPIQPSMVRSDLQDVVFAVSKVLRHFAR